MKLSRVLKNERGIAFPLFVAFLAALLLMFAFISDLGRVLIFRHEMQAIADSLSLAGASAKTVKGVTTNDPDLGEVVSNYETKLDPDRADREAQSAMNQHWSILMDLAQKNKLVSNWNGQVVDENWYHVTLWGQIETPLYASMMELLGKDRSDFEKLTVKVISESQAKEEKEQEN